MFESPILDRFIAIEGLDGAGTTTQAAAVTEVLRGRGPVYLTCEPTDQEIGRLIRRMLHGEVPGEPRSIAHLYAADRTNHLYNGPDSITARLESGETVITDRYLFSSLAYQSVECGFDFVYTLNAPFPLPEDLVYLDLDPAVGERRMARRERRDMYERLAFQEQVREQYERTLAFFSDSAVRIHRIDGSLPVEEITRGIVDALSAPGPKP